MSTALEALYARVTPVTGPLFPLAERDRRRAGEDFPTVPVGGLELTLEETAAALFESATDELALPVPSTDALYEALKAAVGRLGPGGVAEVTETFAGLPSAEFFEVRECRRFAYRLVVSFWYQGAQSRAMTLGEAAVALYLSPLHRYRQAQFRELSQRSLMVSRALTEGMGVVPTETLIRLGGFLYAELGGPQAERRRDAEWLYKQALPDYHRRRFCFDLMVALDPKMRIPLPLVVRPDAGGYLIGLTPPAGPDGMRLHSRRAEW